MSTHYIDTIAAVKLPKEATGYYDDLYILATKGGASNCFYSSGPLNGKRVSDWSPLIAGPFYRVMAKVCQIAGDNCGGMVKIKGQGVDEPERFIRTFRKVLEKAADYRSPEASFRLWDVAIRIALDDAAKPDNYDFKRLTEKRPAPVEEPGRHGGKVKAFAFDIYTDPKEAVQFVECIPYNSELWQHCRLRPVAA